MPESVGLQRGIAAVDLDAIDEPQGDAREVRRARDIVVQADAGEVDGELRGGRAAHGGSGGCAEAPGLGDLDADLTPEHLGDAEAGHRQLFARDDGPGDGGVLRGARGRAARPVHVDLAPSTPRRRAEATAQARRPRRRPRPRAIHARNPSSIDDTRSCPAAHPRSRPESPPRTDSGATTSARSSGSRAPGENPGPTDRRFPARPFEPVLPGDVRSL